VPPLAIGRAVIVPLVIGSKRNLKESNKRSATTRLKDKSGCRKKIAH
jgi:hypothetical protein